ncbi:MAG: GNAT family N-acetyltransferase [Candidatus Thiodiazotropha sp.]
MINSNLIFPDLLDRLHSEASRQRHRSLLVIAGEPAWCLGQAAAALHRLDIGDYLWIGEPAADGIRVLSNDQALGYLGQECGLLVYNAFAGFDPDAFGAVSGTLRGGGLLLLLTPPLSRWHAYPDPQAERIRVAGFETAELEGRFLRRIATLLEGDPSALIVTREAVPPPPGHSGASAQRLPPFTHPLCRTRDQLTAVEAIVRVVTGHRKRPLVLTSDRGRGKSSALGIAAAQLIKAGYRKVLVTAPRQGAVASLFELAARALPTADSSPFSLHCDGGRIDYHAPDHLLSDPQSADLLLVDEAAAIPTVILQGLLARYPCIAFATTVHGYEGTGLGFNIRFKRHLDRKRPQWRELTLSEPIRWAQDDPLERLIFRLLALDATPAQNSLVGDAQAHNTSLEFPTRDQLLARESDLKQLFGLLVTAHYRTTPLDLRHLLDGPNLKIATLRHRGLIVAVALLAGEGGFSTELAEQIWSGRRRPRGHLLAQSLAAHLGLANAATLKGMRIMRIAVHPAAQGRGLGRLLVESIREDAGKAGLDYLGTSFGATPGLIGFWRRCGLQAVRIGLRPGASSSHPSAIFLQPLSSSGAAMAGEARGCYSKQLPAQLGDGSNRLSSSLASLLLLHIDHPSPARLASQDWLDLVAFAFARRGYDLSLYGIERITLAALAEGLVTGEDARLLIKRVIQKQSWRRCASDLKLSGRGALVRQIRRLIGNLVLHYGDDEVLGLVRRTRAGADRSEQDRSLP